MAELQSALCQDKAINIFLRTACCLKGLVIEVLNSQIEYIKSITDFSPEAALVLGSGLGALADEIDAYAVIDYADIPGFPVSTAPTHKGRLILGTLAGAKVVAMQGRVHLYEGYSAQEAVMPIYLMRALGAKTLILTNAAGGINKRFEKGDFMIIEDHISSFVPSALIGKNDESIGPRFVDMSEPYSTRLNKILKRAAIQCGIDIKKGTYIQLTGPCFETKAEIKMCAALGADAVGMSTAIEVQAAKHCGFEVCAVSCITNLACGILNQPLTSEEVSETADSVADKFRALILKTIEEIANEEY